MDERLTLPPPRPRSSPCPKCQGTGRVEGWDANSLKLRREAAGVGVSELARRAGVSGAYLTMVESGKRRVTTKVLAAYRGLGGEG